jgi:hypothetical protein
MQKAAPVRGKTASAWNLWNPKCSLCGVRAPAARPPIGCASTLMPKRPASPNLDDIGRHWTARLNFKKAYAYCTLDGLDGLDGCSFFQEKGFYRIESVEHARDA